MENITATQLILGAAVVGFAALVSGSSGFGFAMLSAVTGAKPMRQNHTSSE